MVSANTVDIILYCIIPIYQLSRRFSRCVPPGPRGDPARRVCPQEVFRTDMDQPDECEDLQFTEWFRTAWSVDNLRRVVDNVTVVTERAYPSSSSSESGQ